MRPTWISIGNVEDDDGRLRWPLAAVVIGTLSLLAWAIVIMLVHYIKSG